MKLYQLVMLVLLLGSTSRKVIAQQQTLDSIRNEIGKHRQADSFRVKAIVAYAVAALNNNTADFLPYMQEVVVISKRIHYTRGLQKGYMIGQIYFSDRGNYEKAFLYADSAFAVLKNDTSLPARENTGHLYNNIASDYFKLGDYEKAIAQYTASAGVFEPMNHPFLAAIYSNMAEVYEKINEPAKAITYDKKAIAMAEKAQNPRSLAMRLLNYSMLLINRKDFNEAATVLNRAEPIVVKLQNMSCLHQYYYNHGYINENKAAFNKAVADYKQALAYAGFNDDAYQKTNVLSALSLCLLSMNNLPSSKLYMDSLLLLSTVHGLKGARRDAYSGYAKWYEKKGDFKNANVFLQKQMSLQDSLVSEETKEKIAGLEIRYNVEKREREIAVLKAEAEIQTLAIGRKNTINYILAGTAAALLIIAFLIYRNYQQKQTLHRKRITELETEKQLLATEAVLKGEEQERTRLAKDLHDGLGGMLSGIKYSFNTMKGNLVMTPDYVQVFERNMDMLDSSIREMRRVAHNMMPEALVNFGLDAALRDFCNDIDQGGALQVNYQSIGTQHESIEQTTAITIYRIVQELINNTLKHAAAKTAIVQVAKIDRRLSVTVEDDGKGFDPDILHVGTGMGWSNIRNRVEFLKGKIDIHSKPGKGVSVLIELDI